MKRILIVAVVVMIILFGVLSLLKSRGVPPPPELPRPMLVAPAPTIVFVQNAPANVVFSLSSDATFSIPEAFPAFHATLANFDAPVSSFASALGLLAPTISTNSTSNKNTYWSNDNYSLSYTQKPALLTMSFRHKTGGLPSSHSTKELAAKDFLKPFVGNAASAYVVLSQTNPTSEGGLYNNPSTITTFLFSYSVHAIPVLITNFDMVSATVSVDENNAVVAATIVFPPAPGTQLSASVPALKEGIIQSLNAGRGLLVSSRDAPKDEYGAPPVFSSVNITGISPVYYYDAAFSLFRPAYLIDGIGTAREKNQVVRYFLYATDQ